MRQRLQEEAEKRQRRDEVIETHTVTANMDPEKLQNFLKSKFLSGKFSAIDVQEGAACGGIESYAKAGKAGAFKGNVYRDLTAKMKKDCNMPQVYAAKIPLWNYKSDEQIEDESS